MTGTFVRALLLVIGASAVFASNSAVQKSPTTPIAVGEMAPDFTLENHVGSKTMLAASRGKNPVVLVFYRGYW